MSGLVSKICSNKKGSLFSMEEFMIYLVLGLTVLNSFMLIYFFVVQTRKNNEIIKELRNDQTNNQKSSDKNKAHIDDMLKMREMYESD